ncbi:S1C family serine protease [Jiangella muralis]|uniref:S1C family serine protease n=1 Tax=Jiangella muralis TaxID=702383 RepID=UPI0009FB6A1A|nr:trypsin-like peptidase domain-containing protein [Jiangella muralis]
MDDVTRNPGEPEGSASTTTLPTVPVPPPPAGTPAGTAPDQAPTTESPRSGWSTPPPSGEQPGAPEPTEAGAAGSPPPHEPVLGDGDRKPEPKRRRAPLVLAGVALGAIIGGAAGAGVAAYVNDDNGNDSGGDAVTRSDLSNSGSNSQQTSNASGVQAVAADVLPSVVSITVASQFGEAGGTGVIISSDGEIVTNNHVVEGAGDGGTVQVTFADGTTADAEVLGTDPLTDLAVIKAKDVSGLQAAELGSSGDLAVGQQVVAIGSPLGLDGTVTTGIVSALDRPVAAGSEQQGSVNSVIDAIQTDAPINPGNSGGPLVNMNGQVVGINSAIATSGQSNGSIGLGFSIPIDQAKPIIDELRSGDQPTHAQIGVGVGDAQGDVRGAEIAQVNDGSAGADAGLQQGDVVTHVGDRVVTDATSLIAAVRSHRPGDEIELTYVRDGQESTTTVTLGSDAPTS